MEFQEAKNLGTATERTFLIVENLNKRFNCDFELHIDAEPFRSIKMNIVQAQYDKIKECKNEIQKIMNSEFD